MQKNTCYKDTHKLQIHAVTEMKLTFTYCTNTGLGCKTIEEHGPRTTVIDPYTPIIIVTATVITLQTNLNIS